MKRFTIFLLLIFISSISPHALGMKEAEATSPTQLIQEQLEAALKEEAAFNASIEKILQEDHGDNLLPVLTTCLTFSAENLQAAAMRIILETAQEAGLLKKLFEESKLLRHITSQTCKSQEEQERKEGCIHLLLEFNLIAITLSRDASDASSEREIFAKTVHLVKPKATTPPPTPTQGALPPPLPMQRRPHSAPTKMNRRKSVSLLRQAQLGRALAAQKRKK